MDVEDVRTIGLAIWRVRDDRGKSLRVVAGLAGMSKDTLNRIERGLLSPTLSQILALAEVLQISVSELTRLPVPAPANGHTDSTTVAIGRALDAIEASYPGGLVLPVAVLRERVAQIHAQGRAVRFAEVATDLPALIRDLHTTLTTGADHGEVLDLAVYLHVHVTRMWLLRAGAPDHLIRRVVFLALRLAQERDEVGTLAVAGFSVADILIAGGALVELGRATLGSLTLPPVTAGTAGFVAVVTACHAIGAVLDGRPGDAVAPMDAAAEIAGRFDVDSLASVSEPTDAGMDRFVFGSVDAGSAQMLLALEANEPDRAVSIGQNVNPDRHPLPVARTQYWIHYGRALSQLRGRRDDAVRALRTAEKIFPTMVLREPRVRDTLAVLLRHSRRGSSTDEVLRGMARRAGLLV
ncbi:MAG TPA: helix-turn-helix transcriptional regulator [Pseudonocardiaceae bacterium]|nr:helix-turn-helix transcriptional regulator [Pseudonocardiaceae bacterium]